MRPRYIAQLSNDSDIGWVILELGPELKKTLVALRDAHAYATGLLGDSNVSTYNASMFWLQTLPEGIDEPQEPEQWETMEPGPLEMLAATHEPQSKSLSDVLMECGARTESEQLHILSHNWIYFSCAPKHSDITVEAPSFSQEMLDWIDSPEQEED